MTPALNKLAYRAANTVEAGHVSRYHAATSVLEKQSIAHHSWGVAVIALYLAGGNCSAGLLQAALMHDAAEAFTGDVPFNVKRDFKDIKERFDRLEKLMYRRYLLQMPRLTKREQALLKLADSLEGYLWTLRHEAYGKRIVSARWEAALAVAKKKFLPIVGQEVIDKVVVFVHHAKNVNIS